MTIKDCAGSTQRPDRQHPHVERQENNLQALTVPRRGFLVRDVNVSSVWLAQQMRSTFVGVINRNGGDIDALFAYLRK